MSSEKMIFTESSSDQVISSVTTPDPEVVAKASRRRFTAAYKLRILAEADGCGKRGEVGALLRREGLYRSHLAKWRQQRREDGTETRPQTGPAGRRDR